MNFPFQSSDDRKPCLPTDFRPLMPDSFLVHLALPPNLQVHRWLLDLHASPF